MCFNLFEWSQVEEITKKLKEKKLKSKSEQKQSENRAKTELCEISQPKEKFCEMSILLPNHSATLWSSLQEFSQLRRRVWHTSATSQHRSPHSAAAKRLRSGKAQISQQKSHSAGYFAIAKAILAHVCHFAAQWHSIHSCETHCEVAAKMAFCYEIGIILRNSNWPLVFRYSYIYRSFELRKGFQNRARPRPNKGTGQCEENS